MYSKKIFISIFIYVLALSNLMNCFKIQPKFSQDGSLLISRFKRQAELLALPAAAEAGTKAIAQQIQNFKTIDDIFNPKPKKSNFQWGPDPNQQAFLNGFNG